MILLLSKASTNKYFHWQYFFLPKANPKKSCFVHIPDILSILSQRKKETKCILWNEKNDIFFLLSEINKLSDIRLTNNLN